HRVAAVGRDDGVHAQRATLAEGEVRITQLTDETVTAEVAAAAAHYAEPYSLDYAYAFDYADNSVLA
uniref:hypothetical protein n=1 Tax=Microbacterium sp. K24 TaxID=2305446 RepID=UPI001443E2EA